MGDIDSRFCFQMLFSLCSFGILIIATWASMLMIEMREKYVGKTKSIDGFNIIGLQWEKTPFIEL